jgi:hypothetical protein
MGMPFQKGQSGNPAGRKPGQLRAIANLAIEARRFSVPALRTLVEVCKNTKQPGAVRVAAATAILDRGFGKPTQSVDLVADVTHTQTDLFSGIPLEDQRRLQAALLTIEHTPPEEATGSESEPVEMSSPPTISADREQPGC